MTTQTDDHTRQATHRRLKRLFDVPLALVLLILLGPLLLLVALAIALDSRGPVLFRQTRIGLHGKLFVILKFRTMRSDTDPLGPSPASGADNRVTRLGRFLRLSALDELPQLLNILRGDMAFVGPRPQLPSEMAALKEEAADLMVRRAEVRPGLTSTWAITPGVPKVAPTMHMLEIDCGYVDACSFWLDAKIVAQTAMTIIKRMVHVLCGPGRGGASPQASATCNDTDQSAIEDPQA